ncbi:MAG TPA: DUF6265 family protein [Steroidobacteraceae bacterium]|nr:DUF6265 family protein [Steroidobacteraceae bacterium]
MKRLALSALTAVLAIGTADAAAAEVVTAHTLRLATGEASPAATIADMAWYAGAWHGAGLGGDNEETWSAPRDGAMMGMYRLLQDGRTVFYEFLTIVEEHHSLSLRLKHFGPDLRGWEEREESVRMPLVAMRAGRICFDGLTFEPNQDGTVTIYLAIRSKDGATREEVFRYRRQVSNGP